MEAEFDPMHVPPKTKARHAIEMIADYYKDRGDESRSATCRRHTTEDNLLAVISIVLRDLDLTTIALAMARGESK